jgi:hypothetical protein
MMQNTILLPRHYVFLPYDVNGNSIKKVSSNHYKAPLFITIFPQNGKTFVLLSYLKKDTGHFSFIERQIVNSGINLQQIIISNIVAKYISNFYISPLRWNSLSKIERDEITKNLNFSLSSGGSSFLDTDLNLFI